MKGRDGGKKRGGKGGDYRGRLGCGGRDLGLRGARRVLELRRRGGGRKGLGSLGSARRGFLRLRSFFWKGGGGGWEAILGFFFGFFFGVVELFFSFSIDKKMFLGGIRGCSSAVRSVIPPHFSLN